MSWKDKLHEHMTEEENDSKEYLEAAEEAENEGHCHEAGVLRDIAHEERIHKRLLMEMMAE